MNPGKVVVLSGSGISAESGLPTFRDAGGLWKQYSWRHLASPEGWAEDPAAVLEFYNERRRLAWEAQPNAAHRAIAELQTRYDAVVVTQNVDELHERAGSEHVIHVHGELAYARSSADENLRYRIGGDPIAMGQVAEDGAQLRPDVVWFGEEVRHLPRCVEHMRSAARLMVVGTSLTVFPAASLVEHANPRAEKILIALEVERPPRGFRVLRGAATELVPEVVSAWLE